MARRVVIWGAGGHALVVADIVRRVGWYDLVGFLDDVNPKRCGEEFGHSTILGGREQMRLFYGMGIGNIIIAIGDNEVRARLAEDSYVDCLELATAIDPRAAPPTDIMVGEGTVIVAGAVVQPGGSIGKNVIINTGATVDHECIIEDGVHIAPGAHLAGRITVGRGTLIGVGAAIITGVQIGAGTIIGAGAVVLKDVPSGVVCYGNPARVVRDR